MQYLIYSQQESNTNGESFFWSNENGWVNRVGATVFDSDKTAPETLTMPLPDGVVLSVEAVDESGFIDVYGRRQCIADGCLVDITARFPEESKLFRYPVALTEALWSRVEREASPSNINGVVRDILSMAIVEIGKTNGEASEYIFSVIIPGKDGKETLELKITVGPDDNLAPCLTVMFPFED